MSSMAAVPGAGTLRGSEFLLFSDWKMLGDQPGLNLTEQTNKARDILIKIVVIVEEEKDQDTAILEETESLKTMLADLMRNHFDFDNIEGSDDWKNAYWIQLSELFYYLFKLQRKLELIETSSQERLGVPDK